jgi:anti-sigma factor RsiW
VHWQNLKSFTTMKTSKCLSDNEIQLYLDSEISAERHQELQKHLVECQTCSNKVAEQRRWIEFVHSSLKGAEVEKDIEIPPFKKELSPAKSKFIKFNFRFLLKIAAVIAVMVSVYLIAEKKETQAYQPSAQELLLWEETMQGDDANQVWHDRTITVMETNSAGEVVNIEIN